MLGYIQNNDTYKYAKEELSARIFADILVCLFDKNTFTSDMAVQQVVDYHTSHGGKILQKDYTCLFFYLVNGPLSGYVLTLDENRYRLDYASDDFSYDMDVEIEEPDFNKWNAELNTYTKACDRVVGRGHGSVYVYYYDIYQKYFTENGSDIWPCKIGMSTGDALKRIVAQTGTAYPEWPHVALIIRTDKPRELEMLLHAVLKLQNRYMDNAPGKEWFMTRPDLIEQIYFQNVGQ